MKAAIIGAGNVGKAVFHDLQYTGMVRELVLVGRNEKKLRAEVMDAQDAAVLRHTYGPRLSCGGFEAVKDADLIIYTAGTSKKVSERMALLHENCLITQEVFSEINRYNTEATVLCITNPLDVITMKTVQVTGRDPRKVIGTGTLLESGRLIRFVADLLDLSAKSVHVTVVGEHGPSAVALLSHVRVMGMPLKEYLQNVTDERLSLNASKLNQAFNREAFRIFSGKGYTSTGVSAAACRIVSAIATDSREVLPVSSVLQGEYGVSGVAVSVPSVIGKNGIEEIRECVMTAEERDAFLASVNIIRTAAGQEGL